VSRPRPKAYRLTQTIAERRLEFVRKGAKSQRVVVRLGLPRRTGPRAQDEWVCPYEILGMPAERRAWALGIDGMQALTLAYHILPVELDRLARRAGGGLFMFLGEPGSMFADGCKLLLDHISAGLSERRSAAGRKA
jgi:uncharacterized protein DUF6968